MIIENLPGSETSFRIIVYDGKGKTIFQTGLICESRKAFINLEDLKPGMYFFKLSGRSSVLKSGMLVLP